MEDKFQLLFEVIIALLQCNVILSLQCMEILLRIFFNIVMTKVSANTTKTSVTETDSCHFNYLFLHTTVKYALFCNETQDF